MVMLAGKSDKGLLRRQNEDAYCIIGGSGGAPVVLAVADGMGGHLAGDIASQTAINIIRESVDEKPFDVTDDDAVDARLFELVQSANDMVYKKSKTEPGCFGMGTTLIIAIVAAGKLVVAHVGDSCAYYISNGEIKKITTDHTYVEELVRIGSLTREEAARHPRRNVITKVVGSFGRVATDIYRVDLKEGDRVLLCTDGLSKMLTEPEIAESILASDNPDEICEALITKSNSRGGLDNTTVLVYLNTEEK